MSLLPEGAANAVQQLMTARPTSVRTRTHPDFAKKLKHLQQSDPVNPKDLTRRLELFLAEQNASQDGIVPRRVKKPQTSTINSQTTSGPPTPPQNILRNSFLPDPLRQNLDFQKFVDNAASNLSTTSNHSEPPIKNFPYPIPVAVLGASSARQSRELPKDTSLYLRTSPGNLPPPPRSSRIEPLKAEIRCVQDEPIPFIGGNADVRRRPESTPYIPRTAAKQLVQTGTPVGAKRGTMHIVPQQGNDLFNEPLPLLTLASLSPLRTSFFNDSPIQNSFANTPLHTTLSPGARTSIGSTSTMANYTTAPTSPAPQQMNSMNSIAVSPADKTSRLEKRRSWHPRNLMASMKPRNESNDRRQTTFQTTAVMVEAARQGQAKEIKIKPRPKSTAFENLTASKSVPDLPGASDAQPMPALVVSKDGKEVGEGGETQVKESLWNRRSRRKTVGAAEAERPKDDMSPMPSVEHLRWKQLAMREKALADSKKAKGDRTTSPKLPVQQVDSLKLDLPSTAYEPKKRITRPLKVVPPPTTLKQTTRQRQPSPPTRYIPQKPIKPQERFSNPVEVRPISRGNDKPMLITRPKGESYPEPTTSRTTHSPITTISPLALSLGVSSLPRGIHLLDDTPTSADAPTSTDIFQIDRDARGLDSIYTTTASEPKIETLERPKHQRDPSKPKLLLGPFPPSRPASPSSSPPKKPLPQPPRFASLQRKAHKSQSASRDVPAEQLTPWDQPMPCDLPIPLEYTRSVSPTHDQQKPKHARQISITKVVSVPRVVTSPAISPPLEISSPREIAQWEILPPREAPAPRDNMPPREQKSPIPPQTSEFRPQSRNNRKVFPSIDVTQPHLVRKRSQPILNQYGEPALRLRASSTDIKPSFLQDSSKPPHSRAVPNALRPKTSGGLRTTPVYTIEVRDHEIAEMTPASVKLLREQQSLLRRRALAAAGHSDPESAIRRSPTPLAELRDRARGTDRSPTLLTPTNKAIGRSPAPLAGPGSARNPYPSPRVSLDRQGRIQTHLGGSVDRRPGPPSLRAPLGSRPPTGVSPKRRPTPETGGSVVLPSPTAQSFGMHRASASVSTQGPPVVPHVSGTQMAEEMKLEREREVNANRAKYGLPARSYSMPYVEEKLAGRAAGNETPDTERRRRGKDKWWKIWRVL